MKKTAPREISPQSSDWDLGRLGPGPWALGLGPWALGRPGPWPFRSLGPGPIRTLLTDYEKHGAQGDFSAELRLGSGKAVSSIHHVEAEYKYIQIEVSSMRCKDS